jgi:hypothetical protein
VVIYQKKRAAEEKGLHLNEGQGSWSEIAKL